MHGRKRKAVLHASALGGVLVVIGLGAALRPWILESLDLARLGSPRELEQREAGLRLARNGSRRAIPRLVRLLKDTNVERAWVPEALQALCPTAVTALGWELEDGLDPGDERVLSFLKGLGAAAREAIPSLIKCLEHPVDDGQLTELVSTIMLIDARAPSLVKPLLKSAVASARLGAIECISKVEENGASFLPDLTPLLKDQDREVRSRAALVLVALGAAGEEVVPALIEGLRSSRFNTHVDAAKALGVLGPKARAALPALVECLKDRSTISLSARTSLLRIAPHDAAPLVARLLEDDDVEVRKSAVQTLGRLSLYKPRYVSVLVRAAARYREEDIIGYANGAVSNLGPAAREAVPDLVDLLKEQNPREQELALYALGSMGQAASDALPALREFARNCSPEIRRSAWWALNEIAAEAEGPPGTSYPSEDELQAIISVARGADTEARLSAISALGGLNSRAARIHPILLESLSDAQLDVRTEAARALLGLGLHGADGLATIAGALSDEGDAVRACAVYLLSRAERPSSALVLRVSELISEPRQEPREAATSVLRAWGPKAQDASPALQVLLKSRLTEVRRSAAEVLEKVAPGEMHVVQALASLLADPDQEVRRAAVSALLAVGGPASQALPALELSLDDGDLEVRLKAAAVIAGLDAKAERARAMLSLALEDKEAAKLAVPALTLVGQGGIPLLRQAFRSKSAWVRKALAEALEARGPGASWAVPELMRALADEELFVRSGAVLALAAIGPAAVEAEPAIIRVAEKDQYGYVRVDSAHTLGRLGVGTEAALGALTRALEGGSEELRARAADYLGNFGEAARPAVPCLEKALRDPEGRVRKAAARALRRIDGDKRAPAR